MSKVIVERPRLNHRHHYVRGGKTVALEDDDGAPLPGRALKDRKEIRTKSLNENLSPLRRFLEGQVGRPWNKVYAEISEHLKATNTVQQHVRDHLEDFVAIKTRMVDGKVVVSPSFRGGETGLAGSYYRLYVHPRTGLLRKNSQYRTWNRRAKDKQAGEAAARADRMREIAPYTQLHLLNDGAWWEVKLDHFSDRVGVPRPADVVLRPGLSDLKAAELYGRHGVYAAEKRPLSKAEIKKLGLR